MSAHVLCLIGSNYSIIVAGAARNHTGGSSGCSSGERRAQDNGEEVEQHVEEVNVDDGLEVRSPVFSRG